MRNQPLVSSVALLLLSCGPAKPPEAPSIDEGWRNKAWTCDMPPDPAVTLNHRESCLLKLLRPRCSEEDLCLIACLVHGAGRSIGGGCEHLCGIRLGDWERPVGWRACYENPVDEPASAQGLPN